jgi:hypothetical protein
MINESVKKHKFFDMFIFKPEKWKVITPTWFNWLRWFLMVGTVGYLAEKTNNLGLQIIYGISFIAFFMFIATTISDILNVNFIKHKLFNKIFTFCMALFIFTVTNLILHQCLKELLKNK